MLRPSGVGDGGGVPIRNNRTSEAHIQLVMTVLTDAQRLDNLKAILVFRNNTVTAKISVVGKSI